VRTISPNVARRLALSAQRLSGPIPAGTAEGILRLVRQLGALQLDPISVVAPSHRLVLWSRLGNYSAAALERLQWQDRRLFEYWAHAASIVLTEDYPIHRRLMLSWRRGESRYSRHFRLWLADNQALQRHVMRELRRRGPLPASAFEDRAERPWQSSGWTAGRNIDRMLAALWLSGTLVVARREAGRRWWDLAERWLPDWTPREPLSQTEVVRLAAQRSLRALGIGRPRDIDRHFTVGRYPGLPSVLASLERSGSIIPVEVKDGTKHWPGRWYVHSEDIGLLDRIEAGQWQPRTTLLSPFDNLIRDRDRTRLMFAFDYSIEIYVPPAKRKYGYYVLPILQGDRLVGRLDAQVDRKQRVLGLRAVYAEDASERSSGKSIAEAVSDLARFVGADGVRLTDSMPPAWRKDFRKALS
jgi:uncharacterized protein YcaQ